MAMSEAIMEATRTADLVLGQRCRQGCMARTEAGSEEGCVQPVEERQYWGGTEDLSKQLAGSIGVHQQGKVA